MKVIVLFAVLVISVSAYSERVFEAAEGYNAPSMTIENSDTTLSLADMKGRYVIVTFWSSADADSRLRGYSTGMTRQPSCSRRNDFVSCRSTSTVASASFVR